MEEEEVRVRPATGIGRDLSALSVADLHAYVAALEAEIVRVRAEVERRQDVRGAAEALFRRPGGDRSGPGPG